MDDEGNNSNVQENLGKQLHDIAYTGPRLFGAKTDWMRLAVLLWIILTVAVCVKTIVQPTRRTVYPVFALGSQHWWQDVPLHATYKGRTDVDLYRYSPTFAIAFTPFALLPDWLGGLFWNLLCIGIFFFSLRRLVEVLLPGAWPPYREGIFLCLALVGSVRGIWAGLSNGLLFAMVIFAAISIMRNRNKTAAWLLAGAVYIKVWPIAAALLLIACWPRRLFGHFVVAIVALALVPYLTRPFGVVNMQYAQWYTSVVEVQQDRWPGVRDFWTVLEYLHLSGWHPLYYIIMFSTAVVACGWVLYQKRRNVGVCFFGTGYLGTGFFGTGDKSVPCHDTSNDNQAMRNLLTLVVATWISWQLLFGPGSERLTYQIISPIATWALVASWGERRGRWMTLPAWLCVGILGTGAVERALLPVWSGANSILPLGAIIFVVWLVVHETGQMATRKQSTAK